MYVCLCHAVTDSQIKDEVAKGACKLEDLRDSLGVGAGCGQCDKQAKQLLKQIKSQTQTSRER